MTTLQSIPPEQRADAWSRCAYDLREGPADLSQNDPADMVEVRLADLFSDGHDND